MPVDRIRAMIRKAAPPAEAEVRDAAFDSVAELFGVLSTPIRLKTISTMCDGEMNVSLALSRGRS